jgi:hypothetical protein
MKSSALLVLLAVTTVVAAPAELNQVPDNNRPNINDPKFIGTVMDAHWYWRTIHCAQPLTWDPALAQAALDSVSACTQHPQHVRNPAQKSVSMYTNIFRTVVAVTSRPKARTPLAAMTLGSRWPGPWFMAGMRKSSNTRTITRTTKTPGATSRSSSGVTLHALAVRSDTALKT